MDEKHCLCSTTRAVAMADIERCRKREERIGAISNGRESELSSVVCLEFCCGNKMGKK